jgi:hypothetical protein
MFGPPVLNPKQRGQKGKAGFSKQKNPAGSRQPAVKAKDRLTFVLPNL